MSKAMPTAPSAPLMDEQQLVGHHGPPPPSYDQAVGQQAGYMPPIQQVMPPYPPQNYMPPGPGMMMPPPQPHLPPPPQQVQVVQIPTTTMVAVGPKSVKVRCPVCHADIKTTTVTQNQAGAHIACIVLCLLGCCLCSCIPYCMDSCKNVSHTCPSCKSYLGTFKA